jgi:acetyltransferase
MREVSYELLDKLIHYDPACAMAFLAVDEQSQKMLGVVRLHDDTSRETAEFAFWCVRGLRSTASVGC